MPLLLALLGVALLGIAIFAPRRVAAEPTVSFTPRSSATPMIESYAPGSTAAPAGAVPVAPPGWAVLIDPRAVGCDAAARAALVEALATVESAWARDVLLHAQAEEPDVMVRAALYAALGRELSETAEV
jgi:hypothetical protein